MNSDQEKKLFQRWGWQYDYAQRKWVSPNGSEISTDNLVLFCTTPDSEQYLTRVIISNGIYQGEPYDD